VNENHYHAVHFLDSSAEQQGAFSLIKCLNYAKENTNRILETQCSQMILLEREAVEPPADAPPPAENADENAQAPPAEQPKPQPTVDAMFTNPELYAAHVEMLAKHCESKKIQFTKLPMTSTNVNEQVASILKSINPFMITPEECVYAELSDKMKQNFGNTRHFCPVSLKTKRILVRGSEEFCCKCNNQVYLFSSADDLAEFKKAPQLYLNMTSSVAAPKLFVVGFGYQDCVNYIKEVYSIPVITVSLPSIEKLSTDQNYTNVLEQINSYKKEEEDKKAAKAAAAAQKKDDAEEPAPEEEESEEEQQAKMLKRTFILLQLLLNNEPYRTSGCILAGFPESMAQLEQLYACNIYPDAVLYSKIVDTQYLKLELANKVSEAKANYRAKLFSSRQKKAQDKLKSKQQCKCKFCNIFACSHSFLNTIIFS